MRNWLSTVYSTWILHCISDIYGFPAIFGSNVEVFVQEAVCLASFALHNAVSVFSVDVPHTIIRCSTVIYLEKNQMAGLLIT